MIAAGKTAVRREVIMRTVLFTLIAILGITTIGQARQPETVSLRAGQQKRVAKGELTLKFISVEEDSRCPEKAVCVWAGNAKIKVKIGFPGGDSKTVFLNTNMGPQGDQMGGWAINLTGLTNPSVKRPVNKNAQKAYTATFSISRLTR
jgi:hypothetical protein